MFSWRLKRTKVASLVTGILVAGCVNWDTSDRQIDPVEVNHALSLMDSCEDYEAYAKETAIQRMRTIIEKNCQYMLDEVDYYGSDFGGWGAQEDSASGDSDGDVDGDSSGSGEYSETNTQEEGVDEADILKTDGEFIYVLSGKDMVIVTVGEDGVLTEIGRVTLEGKPAELFLYGEVAVVFGGIEIGEEPEEIEYPEPPSSNYYYYYDGWGDWYGDWYTRIQILDLSDKTAPVVLKNTAYAGRYVSSRRVGNALRAAISSPMPALEVQTWIDLAYWDMSPAQAKHEINKACDALIENNIEIINAVTLDDILPRKMGSAEASEPIVECEDIYGPATPAGTGLVTIISLDLDRPLADQTDVAVMGQEGIIYASTSALYLTTARDYAFNAWMSGFWMDETSGIHKFDIESTASEALYVATGTVSGRMLDQFCLGEYEGFLRVATTTGSAWWEDNTLDNHITILEESGGELTVAGKLDGIGTGEEIYASRFMGDRGFMVTYLQMDPLFTFDLSDPHSPKVVGEWEGPGYSTYLHPYGDDYLIAVGLDENWRTVVSLYNLENFASPTLVERQPLPGAGYQTAALYEHKAFTFNPTTGELMLPFYDWGYNQSAATGVLLYDITPKGVSLEGTLDMGGDTYNEGPARRSMYNGENLIGVSACRITSAPLSDPSAVISSIPIWEDSCAFPGWWSYYY